MDFFRSLSFSLWEKRCINLLFDDGGMWFSAFLTFAVLTMICFFVNGMILYGKSSFIVENNWNFVLRGSEQVVQGHFLWEVLKNMISFQNSPLPTINFSLNNLQLQRVSFSIKQSNYRWRFSFHIKLTTVSLPIQFHLI